MRPLHELLGSELRWSQPSWTELRFQLQDGDQVVATLTWEGVWRPHARAESAAGTFLFRQAGLFSSETLIRRLAAGPEAPAKKDPAEGPLVAEFRPDWLGNGDFVLADGQRFGWHQDSWLQSDRLLTAADGSAVLQLKPGLGLRAGGVLLLQPGFEKLSPESGTALALGAWYQTVMWLQYNVFVA